jgi:hypothetical protein
MLSWIARLARVSSSQIVRKALYAAVLVGGLLILLNQGDALFSGRITRRLLKTLLTPIIPFCVTLLGALLNSRLAAPAEALRPGWAAIRRSIVIAVLVGSVIIALNQGDLILSGALTPWVCIKILVTPCVPFCVSLYGASLAYRHALAAHQER